MLRHKGTQKLSTERLILRKYALSDAADIYHNYGADERVCRYLSWKPYENVAGIEVFLADSITAYARKNAYHWAIENKGAIIGSISVTALDESRLSCEIGYCLGQAFWNQGIATEALRTVLDFLFGQVGMHRIMAKHDVENPASGKVMRNCRMIYEGRMRDYYLRHDDSFSDAMLFAALKSDWPQGRLSRKS